MNDQPDAQALERLRAALVANVGGCSGWEFDGTDPAGGFGFGCECGTASGLYATYVEGAQALDNHLDELTEDIGRFVQTWFADNPSVAGEISGAGWSVHIDIGDEPDPQTSRRPMRVALSSVTARGPETEPIDDDETADTGEAGDGYQLPAIDFPVYGCDATWTGPRWLDFVQFQMSERGEGITEVWTAHGRTRFADPASPSIRVGTVPLAEYERLWVGPDQDVARSVAFTALFALMDRTSPTLPDQQRNGLWRAIHDTLDERVDGWESWPRSGWQIDGKAATGHIATWAGAWAGITFDVPAVALIVIANGIDPAAVRLAAVGDGRAYHVDLRQPLNYPGALEESAAAALGDDADDADDGKLRPWPLHPDHERLLGG